VELRASLFVPFVVLVLVIFIVLSGFDRERDGRETRER
jgi:hypothetical protein